MHFLWRIPLLLCMAVAQFAAAQAVQPAQPNRSIDIGAYNIDAVLDPTHHSMSAQAAVTFTALKNLATVTFELNPALQVSSVKDDAGHILSAMRASPGREEIGVTPSIPLKSGEAVTWTFAYRGVFDRSAPKSANESDAASVQLASVGDPASCLLYAARWFPMVGYLTDRFTATMHVHVPTDERVLGSGFTGTPHLDKNGLMVFDFNWPQPGFPGTIIAGKFHTPYASETNPNVRVFLLDHDEKNVSQANGPAYAAMAYREYSYFTSEFGPADSNQLNVVELPNGTVPAYWAPEIAAIAGPYMREEPSRLLANAIAHQWWGNDVSPATLNDAWITNGMSRYAELEYLRHASGEAAFANAVLNISASALAYDTVPLSNSVHYAPFSTEFQSMTYDKGAMIFRMLQWQIGDQAFRQTLHGILSEAGKSISSIEVEKIAEAASKQHLRPFFMQWLNDTGAPTYKDDWTLYRLGNNKGFRTVGEIDQDLDLFRMPVEVSVETVGKTVNQRVEVVGPQSRFTIDTSGVPRKISIDPDRWLLRNDSDMQVRVHILRGQQMAAKSDSARAIHEYREALGIDSISSLASYRLGEVYFGQRNYQAAADAFRDALHGDGIPKWTEVWSNFELGKIFDVSGQRDRAVNQYREVLQTQDNTGGVLDLAREYLQHAYQPMP